MISNSNCMPRKEVDLLDIFFMCIYKWKLELVCGLILAIMVGSFHYYSYNYILSQEGTTKYEEEKSDYILSKEQYDQAVLAYKQDLLSSRELISLLSAKVEQAEIFNSTSPRMLLDPYNYYSWTISMYVDTDYKIMPSMTYQDKDNSYAILKAYSNELLSSETKGNLASKLDVDLLYIDDIYSVSVDSEGFLYVTVLGIDEDSVLNVKEYVKELFPIIKDKISNSFGNFDTTFTDFGIVVTSSLSMVSYQESKKNELISLQSSLNEARNTLANIKEPEKIAESLPSRFSHTPKMMVLGFVAGVILVVLFATYAALIEGRVLSSSEICSRLGLHFLGDVSNIHYRGITRFFRLCNGCKDLSNIEHDSCLIADNIVNYSKEIEGTILITGSGNQKDLMDVAKKIQDSLSIEDVVVFPSMLGSSDTLRILPKCTGVVLIEQRYISRYSNIELEIAKIEALKNVVIGVAIIE